MRRDICTNTQTNYNFDYNLIKKSMVSHYPANGTSEEFTSSVQTFPFACLNYKNSFNAPVDSDADDRGGFRKRNQVLKFKIGKELEKSEPSFLIRKPVDFNRCRRIRKTLKIMEYSLLNRSRQVTQAISRFAFSRVGQLCNRSDGECTIDSQFIRIKSSMSPDEFDAHKSTNASLAGKLLESRK